MVQWFQEFPGLLLNSRIEQLNVKIPKLRGNPQLIDWHLKHVTIFPFMQTIGLKPVQLILPLSLNFLTWYTTSTTTTTDFSLSLSPGYSHNCVTWREVSMLINSMFTMGSEERRVVLGWEQGNSNSTHPSPETLSDYVQCEINEFRVCLRRPVARFGI